MNKIYITELAVNAIIGVYDWERKHKQPLFIDLELGYDMQPAIDCDDISSAIDYDALCQRITDFIESSHFQLIESLANAICTLIFNEFPSIQQAQVQVAKPKAITNAANVSVSIFRQNTCE